MTSSATLHEHPNCARQPDLGGSAEGGAFDSAAAVVEAEKAESWWTEQWARFPTYRLEPDGTPRYWAVPEDSGVYQDDWPLGERLAEETVRHMRRFPEGSTVLRHILREIDQNSTIAQGFLNRLEDILISPTLYASLDPEREKAEVQTSEEAKKAG